MSGDPEWLRRARAIQAIAQNGLAFTRDPYDRERYEQLRDLSVEIFAAHSDEGSESIGALFANESGYTTPKVDVRAAIFDEQGRVLMVREAADADRWTFPGGWADVNVSGAENAVKEALEESGFTVEITKLAAVWDRTLQRHPSGVFSCYKMFFIGHPVGGAATTGLETSAVAWFAQGAVPSDLSEARVLRRQVDRMFEHHRHPLMPADYD